MTPQEFKTIRLQLGLTQAELAPLLGYRGKRAVQAVSKLECERVDIPWHVGRLMLCYQIIASGLGRNFIPD